MVTKVQIRSQFDLLNELTLRLIEELKEYGFAKAEYYQLPEISSIDENIKDYLLHMVGLRESFEKSRKLTVR